ncbi:MAG: hypothetical protein A2X19_00805 [Bacteroidetes bacterium GWE2_39_28]|nr:MAG: hypothetical protein A2X19_00805 [Bacteroidetes bacterium GWE2_39_28]OFY12429.1 MAG: hypothetical protein A2X16_10730 [Bacteroidetes bacterium GWF2_39_10]OFZ09828.1 MAG: hypothetical protein A2465_04670 [Bacteroidetes bacterium RIFOXYC2_FULL_39_11]HCT93370.1 hypothetical protein [Rikenellaceae bacterium]
MKKSQLTRLLLLIGAVSVFLYSCKKIILLLASISTATITNISSTGATSGGNITSDGGAAITSRGICWSTDQNPSVANSKTNDGAGVGTFSSTMGSLSPGTTYYVKAYAVNSVGTAYGTQVSFTTSAILSTLTTAAATSITSTSATSGGVITNDGGAAITARGVVWSHNPGPTLSDSKTTNGSGTGTFTSSLTGLTPGNTYYVKAYATNSVGTAYGNQITFTTTTTVPVLTTTDATSITTNTASCGGNISSDGGEVVYTRGVCWSTSQNPTTANSKVAIGGGTGSFNGSLTGLSPGTVYYARAYATNSIGTGYGNQISFSTLATLPVVTTTSLSNVTSTSFVSGGNVTTDGGSDVRARGVCWSTSTNPTVDNSKTTNGTGTGAFTSYVTGLTAGVTYYVRAYATNGVGTAYGAEFRANGLTHEINELVPESIIEELKRLGMPINTGNSPPIVNNIYNVSPLRLKGTNIPGDWALESRFNDVRIRFHSQNNTNLTIGYEDVSINYTTGAETGSSSGTAGYIVGSGNVFTAFLKVVSTRLSGEYADLVYVISGTLAGNGINNLNYSIFMLNNHGYSTVFIDNGQGRVFYDSDYFSEIRATLRSASLPTKSSSAISAPDVSERKK